MKRKTQEVGKSDDGVKDGKEREEGNEEEEEEEEAVVWSHQKVRAMAASRSSGAVVVVRPSRVAWAVLSSAVVACFGCFSLSLLLSWTKMNAAIREHCFVPTPPSVRLCRSRYMSG